MNKTTTEFSSQNQYISYINYFQNLTATEYSLRQATKPLKQPQHHNPSSAKKIFNGQAKRIVVEVEISCSYSNTKTRKTMQ